MTVVKRLIILILCCAFLCVPVQAAESEKQVALTFDDGPSGRFTRRLLEGLEERNAKDTFLLHGYSHKSMQNMCRRDVKLEIEKAMALVPTGCQVSFLRSPGGFCGECVQPVAAQMGLCVLSGSVDPKDWATNDTQAIEPCLNWKRAEMSH